MYVNRRHKDILYTNKEIEENFFIKLALDIQMGGVEPSPVSYNNILTINTAYTNFVLNRHYKKYYVKNCQYDNSLLTLALLYEKFKDIFDNEHRYLNIFGPSSIIPGLNLSFDDEFDSLFVYTKVYNNNINNPVDLEDRFHFPPLPPPQKYFMSLFDGMNCVDNGIALDLEDPPRKNKLTTSVFITKKMVFRKYILTDGYGVEGYYLFPFLEISDKFINNDFVKKSTLINPVNNTSKKRSQEILLNTQIILDILNNFISHLSNLNSFLNKFELNFNELCKDSSVPNLFDIYTGIQNRYVVYFCLLLFNFKCKFVNIKNIHNLFKKNGKLIINVTRPPGLTKRGDRDEIFYSMKDELIEIESAYPIPLTANANAHTNINELNNTNPDINVIGLFTDLFDNSNILPDFNPTQINGWYFLMKNEITEVYNDLKNELIEFLLNFEKHFIDPDNIYSNIRIL